MYPGSFQLHILPLQATKRTFGAKDRTVATCGPAEGTQHQEGLCGSASRTWDSWAFELGNVGEFRHLGMTGEAQEAGAGERQGGQQSAVDGPLGEWTTAAGCRGRRLET